MRLNAKSFRGVYSIGLKDLGHYLYRYSSLEIDGKANYFILLSITMFGNKCSLYIKKQESILFSNTRINYIAEV